MKIKYVSWNYCVLNGETMHLVRLVDGKGILRTNKQMAALNLAEWECK